VLGIQEWDMARLGLQARADIEAYLQDGRNHLAGK
jgi:hypothetical protein